MTPPPPDSVDRFLEASLALFPGVDPETEGLIDRIHKIAKHAKRLNEATSKRFGLNAGEFHTLVKLRVAPDHRLSAGDLAEHLDLSTGAMTNRLDGLEDRGLVVRERASEDRRSVLVRMTDDGARVITEAAEAAGKEETALLSALSDAERRRLNALLRALVISFEEPGAPPAIPERPQVPERPTVP
jgi:DNA-binding MarR family transcriptional regulator